MHDVEFGLKAFRIIPAEECEPRRCEESRQAQGMENSHRVEARVCQPVRQADVERRGSVVRGENPIDDDGARVRQRRIHTKRERAVINSMDFARDQATVCCNKERVAFAQHASWHINMKARSRDSEDKMACRGAQNAPLMM